MKNKLIAVAFFATTAFVSCDKEDTAAVPATTGTTTSATTAGTSTSTTTSGTDTTSTAGTTTSDTSTTGTTTSGTSTTGTTSTGSTATKSSYTFADDGIECTPFSKNPKISDQGILYLVSNQCQGTGSKLDGYFKYSERPSSGKFTIVGTAGQIPDPFSFKSNEYGMVFYGHANTTWYATAGTVTLTTNSSDTAKLDMTWTDVIMTSSDGTKTVKFSGTLLAL